MRSIGGGRFREEGPRQKKYCRGRGAVIRCCAVNYCRKDVLKILRGFVHTNLRGRLPHRAVILRHPESSKEKHGRCCSGEHYQRTPPLFWCLKQQKIARAGKLSYRRTFVPFLPSPISCTEDARRSQAEVCYGRCRQCPPLLPVV